MPQVLIIGPNFYNFTSAVSNAFQMLGWNSFVECYDNPVHPYTFGMKLRYKIATNKEIIKIQCREKYAVYIKDRYDNIKPDMVFILNGDMLLHEVLDYFRKSAKVVLWLFDSITRFPVVTNHIDHVDYLFCYEQSDVEWYQSQGKTAYFLPQACDSTIYKSLENVVEDIDILFVGDLYSSKKRQCYIRRVVNAFPQKNICVFGVYKPWYKNPIKCLLREHRSIYRNININSILVNEYYNRAKIVINIHHEQQKNGANPKVFEICGSGAYQVCDENPYIRTLFPNGEIGLYSSEQGLIDQIEWAFANINLAKEKACCAQSEVLNSHTFFHRIRLVLSYVFPS